MIDKRHINVDYAAAITFDSDEGDNFLVNMTGNITGITLKNPYKGREITLIFKQDATGSRGISGWDSIVKISGASFSPTTTANSYSTIAFIYDDTNWIEVSRSLDVR